MQAIVAAAAAESQETAPAGVLSIDPDCGATAIALEIQGYGFGDGRGRISPAGRDYAFDDKALQLKGSLRIDEVDAARPVVA